MRRVAAIGLAAAAAALVAAVCLSVARTPVQGAEAAVLAALRDASGLRIESDQQPVVRFFPTPRVTLEGVRISQDGEPPFATARRLTSSPRILPLLAGRIEARDVTLIGAEVALDRAPLAEFTSATLAAGAHSAAYPSIRLVDARLSWGARTLEKVDASLVWPSAGRALSASGFGLLGDRQVEAALALTDPAALARGEASPFRARVEGGGASLVFDGDASLADGPRLSGDISARAASLRETLRWLGAPAPRRSSPLTGFSLTGRAIADHEGFAVSNAELNLEGGAFFGAGRLTLENGRPSIEATLDTGRLDLDPYVNGIAPALRDEGGGWNPKRIDLKPVKGYDLDLRLSADQIRLGDLRIGETAATISVANDSLDVAIGEAEAYDGTVGGRLSLSRDPRGVRIRVEGALSGVDLQAALRRFVTAPVLTGSLSGELSIEGAGASIAAVVASLHGRAEAHIADGTFYAGGKGRALTLAGLRGAMKVSAAQATIEVKQGVAYTRDLSIVGEDATLTLAGEARLVERELKLQGSVRPPNGKWVLPVRLEGSFLAPKLKAALAAGEARASGE